MPEIRNKIFDVYNLLLELESFGFLFEKLIYLFIFFDLGIS